MNNQLIQQIENLKEDTISALQQLKVLAKERFDIQPPNFYDELLENLRTGKYIIPIIGEAKRGKSSFINAVISDDTLPVDDHIATSQAFKITASETESYKIIFTDETSKDVDKSYISKLGSQVKIDTDGSLIDFGDKEILWIEINRPNKFLPKNISLIDTPGLGALYSQHAEITYKIFPLSNAAIFVLDSEKPIQESELAILWKLIKWTKNIFFIQTKIDVTKGWEDILSRNKDILSKEFEKVLEKPLDIYPLSNTFLRKADSDNEKKRQRYYEKSFFDQLRFNLEFMLIEKFGWNAIASGIRIGLNFSEKVQNRINKEYNSLQELSNSEINKEIKKKGRRLERLNLNWKEDGIKKKLYVNNFRAEVRIFRKEFDQLFQTNGAIYDDLLALINNASDSASSLRKIKKDLASILIGLFEDHFLEIDNALRNELIKSVKELYKDKTLYVDDIESSALDIKNRIEGVLETMMKGSGWWGRVSRIIGNFLYAMISFAGLGRVIRDWFRGADKRESLIKEIKSVSIKILGEMKGKCEKVRPSSGQKTSPKEIFFNGYIDKFNEIITADYDEQKRNLVSEIESQKKILLKEKAEKQNQVNELENFEKEWKKNGNLITKIDKQLNEIKDKFIRREYQKF